MDYLGAHMSIAGGIHLALDRGVQAGCGVIQVFTQNTNQWRGKAVSDADAALFRTKRQESGIHDVVSHDIYLVNLGAPPGEIRDKSLAGFREEMERCARLGIGKIVMHPGAHTGDGEDVGLRRIIEAFDQPVCRGACLYREGAPGNHRRPGIEPRLPVRAPENHHRRLRFSRTASACASTPATSSPAATTSPPKTAISRPLTNSTASSASTGSRRST